MRFRLLGPLHMEGAGIGGRNVRILLATLLIAANRPVSSERLADVLWGTAPPKSAANYLQVLVHRLRQAIGEDRITTYPYGYSLAVEDDELDAAVFQALVSQARNTVDLGQRRELLREALGLWRGPVLADLADVPAFRETITRLTEARLSATEELIDADLTLGDHEKTMAELAALVVTNPLRERLRAQHMTALYRCDRSAEALQSFQDARELLREELGVEPGEALQRVHLAILRGDADLAAPAPPVPHELPAAVAGFTGREDAIKALDSLLAGHQVAAITGTPGAGKTALAVHWAHRSAHLFPDGQLYLNLLGYADHEPMRPHAALAMLLEALGTPSQQIPTDTASAAARFRTAVSGRRLLILLDNARSASQVRPLLPAAPGCFVLVTSRDRLSELAAYEGVRRVVLDILPQDEARDLMAAVIGSERVDAEPQAMAELVRLCGGLPLALRIAAARLADRPQGTIAEYVASHHAFTLGGVDALRATFELSYRALPADAQLVFRCLGLIALPEIGVESAAMLAGVAREDADRALEQLAAAHLLSPVRAHRYAMHDLLRQYARSLNDSATHPGIQRLFDWYLRATTEAAQALRAADGHTGAMSPADALAWLNGEYPNLSVGVMHAARSGPFPMAWLLMHAILDYQDRYHHSVDRSGLAQAAVAAARRHGDSAAQAVAYQALAHACFGPSRGRRSQIYIRRAAQLARESGGTVQEAGIVLDFTLMLILIGDLRTAAGQAETAIRMYENAGDLGGRLRAMNLRAHLLSEQGDLRESLELVNRAYALVADERSAIAGSLVGTRANVLNQLGEFGEARATMSPALVWSRRTGDRITEANSHVVLTEAAIGLGEPQVAAAHAADALMIAEQIGNPWLLAEGRYCLGLVALAQGDPQRAVHHWEEAIRHAGEVGYRFMIAKAELALAGNHADHVTAADHARRAYKLSSEAGYGRLREQAADLLTS